MEEKLIRNISIISSVAGLAVLFLISKNFQLNQTDIVKLGYEDVGKIVRVCGEVSSNYSSKTGHQFLKLKDSTGSINIVIFNTTAKKFNLNSDSICVVGTVDEYENRLEMIAKDVKVT